MSTLHKFQRRLKAGLLKNSPKNLVEQSHVFGLLCPQLDELFLKPKVRTCSGTVPGTSRKGDLENREPTRDCSQNGVELSSRWTSKLADSEQGEASRSAAIRKLENTKRFAKKFGTFILKFGIEERFGISRNYHKFFQNSQYFQNFRFRKKNVVGIKILVIDLCKKVVKATRGYHEPYVHCILYFWSVKSLRFVSNSYPWLENSFSIPLDHDNMVCYPHFITFLGFLSTKKKQSL